MLPVEWKVIDKCVMSSELINRSGAILITWKTKRCSKKCQEWANLFLSYAKLCLLAGNQIEARWIVYGRASVIFAIVINHNLTDFKISRLFIRMLIVLLCSGTVYVWDVLSTFRKICCFHLQRLAYFDPEDGSKAPHTFKLCWHWSLPHI
jgi:hypothetical protein